MRISRFWVNNFRNLGSVDLAILPGTVVVGENRSGKSNLVHALRLILDPNLSHSDRQLGHDDFWDGCCFDDDGMPVDPMEIGREIEVGVELCEFDDDEKLVATLRDALVVVDPMQARLVYRFAPTGASGDGQAFRYLGAVYGGYNLDRPISTEFRAYLHMLFMHALRDVEADIRNWRRSPLRALLQAAASLVSAEDLAEVRAAMQSANESLNGLDPLRELGQGITERLHEMVGPHQAVETDLAAAPDDPLRLIRGMRLFVDGDARRSLSSASLGTLNVLYLALHELGLDARLLGDAGLSHVLMAIEEPEAHLHPHLQRLIFRRILDQDQASTTAIVTTQSPYIASVADPRSLVVLRDVGGRSEARSAADAQLSGDDWNDVARYLDATRAELVFARRVLLVEGYAEQVLVPRFAESAGMNLDKLGITVCAIHGTHFSSYVKVCIALGIPWAVATDGDTQRGEPEGSRRTNELMVTVGLSGRPAENGIFVGSTTLEYDLLMVDENIGPAFETLSSLCAKPSQDVIFSWSGQAPSYADFMKIVSNSGGKGRYAQRLALKSVVAPAHISDALSYLSSR